MTTSVMNSLAGTESFLQERAGSGRAMAVPAVPVMRVNTLGGSKCSPNVHKYQLTCYRNNDLAQFWKTSVTCERGFAQPCRVSFGLCLYPHKMAAPRLLRF